MAAHHNKNSSILGDSNKKVLLIQPPLRPYASQTLVAGAVPHWGSLASFSRTPCCSSLPCQEALPVLRAKLSHKGLSGAGGPSVQYKRGREGWHNWGAAGCRTSQRSPCCPPRCPQECGSEVAGTWEGDSATHPFYRLLVSLIKAKSIQLAAGAGRLLGKETLRELFALVRREGELSHSSGSPVGNHSPFLCCCQRLGMGGGLGGRGALHLLGKFKEAASG